MNCFQFRRLLIKTNYSVKILQFFKNLALGMVTVKVLYFLSATYLAICKNFLIEVEDEKDYVEPSPVEDTGEYFTRISKLQIFIKFYLANNQRRFWGPWQKANALKSEKEEIKLLKEGMERVFGKDWNPSDVKEAFDISDKSDYVDGDTEESQLLVGIDDNEKLLSMGRIKVRQV